MKIELRISPVYLYLVTPLYKSFLLWKRFLWCIIWFSLWKWTFILYDSCYSRGAPAPFHFMVSSGRRESESLVVSLFEKQDFTQANYICRYLDLFLWLIVNRESDYSSRTSSQPGIHRASAHYRRLTNITLNKRYCSH